MIRFRAVGYLAGALIGTVSFADAQVHPIRSLDYLSSAGVSDTRATWINPAGLGAVPEASVLFEITAGRSPADQFEVEQFALGFNSRGVSITYVRNRFPGRAESTTMLRFATGVPITRGAFGFAVTLYGAPGDNDRGWDTGFQYSLTQSITTGTGIRNMGRPVVGVQKLPIVLYGGILASLGGGTFQVSADANATEVLGAPSREYMMGYKGILRVNLPLRKPMQLLAAVDLGSNLRVNQIHIGVGVGGRSQVMAVGTGVSRGGTPTFDRLSLVGVNSRLLAGR